MSNEMVEFKMAGWELNALNENGKIWFVANDVAKALGYADPKNAVSTHCKGVLKRPLLTKGGIQQMNVIPEGDLYRLICGSKLPAAERFETWVFDEIIPSLRIDGGVILSTPEDTPEMIMARGMVCAMAAIEKEKDKRLEAERIAELKCIENAELIRTKSHIQGRIMATTMQGLAVAKQSNRIMQGLLERKDVEIEKLEKLNHQSVADNSWRLKEFILAGDAKKATSTVMQELSKTHGYKVEQRMEPRRDSPSVPVKIYHEDVWEILMKQLESGVYPAGLEIHRKVKVQKPVKVKKQNPVAPEQSIVQLTVINYNNNSEVK